jgi:hypothetical protein
MNKIDSGKQEKRLAKLTGGRKTIASGAFSDKGDVETDLFLVECKITGNKSFRITLKDWETIRIHALRKHKTGIMHLDISGTRLFVIPEFLLKEVEDALLHTSQTIQET